MLLSAGSGSNDQSTMARVSGSPQPGPYAFHAAMVINTVKTVSRVNMDHTARSFSDNSFIYAGDQRTEDFERDAVSREGLEVHVCLIESALAMNIEGRGPHRLGR